MRAQSIASLVVVLLLLAGGSYAMFVPNPITGDPLISNLKLGLDLRGGTHVVLEAQDTATVTVNDEAMNRALEIIRFRVDKLGVAEPTIQRQGERRIIVELAGVQDPEEAIHLIGRTAMLQFRDPNDEIVITGADLVKAQAVLDRHNRPVVVLELKPEAKRRFAEATTANVGRPIHILLDDELVQSPIVQSPGIEEPEISGYASLQEAQRIAMLLNSGALPVPMKVVENRIISASLGQDSIEKGKRAVVVGVVAVAIFMVVVYRMPGLVAVVALAMYGLLLLGILIGIGAVLTLPGIAGIVLSLGMAVDANVIVFERIKDELAAGKTLRSSVEGGFSRALRTIVDANVTTLIAGAVLFYFGSGPIRGFAVTLSLGILVSMFTAVIVTRFMLRQLLRGRLLIGEASFVRGTRG